jgi:hypothetical protein
MIKNTAGQKIGAQLVSATDGSAFTGAVTVYVCGDAGTQSAGSVGSGACTHEGNGYHTYAPAQAETNYDLIAFTFIGSGAVPVTVQVFTVGGALAQQASVDDLETRLSAARAGYLDNLSAGAVALDSTVMKAASYTAPLDAAGTRTAIGLATANLDNQLADLPTNAELSAALAGADDAVLAAIAALNNLSSAGAQAAATAALNAYAAAKTTDLADLPTNAELTAALNTGVNVTKVRGISIAGSGTEADPWGPTA